MKRLAIAFIACSLSASALAEDPAEFPRPLTEAEKASIRVAVKREMKDPGSATFRWNPEVLEKTVYCGFVNGKNSYGGYTGHTLFMALLGTNKDGVRVAAIAKIDGKPDEIGTSAEATMCADSHYNLLPSSSATVDD